MDSVDFDGDGLGNILTIVTNSGSTIRNTVPVWSPDGLKILFSRNQPRTNGELFSVASDGTGLVQITSDPSSNDTSARYLA